MIHYVEFAPTTPLLPFIECIWTLKSHNTFFNKRELIIPGGRTEMMFNLSDPVLWIDSKDFSMRTCQGAYLLGPRNRHFFVEHTGAINLVGVRFRHGGLSAFTRVPMDILMNEIVPQDELFGPPIDVLMGQLLQTNQAATQIGLIESFLKKQFQSELDASKIIGLITEVKKYETASSMKILTEKTGIHYKKLERVFSKYTGYNPKNFTRVIRFYKAVGQMQKSMRALTDVGLDGGYYDQAHFIRDFKAFTGKSPRQFQTENPTIANLLLRSKHV